MVSPGHGINLILFYKERKEKQGHLFRHSSEAEENIEIQTPNCGPFHVNSGLSSSGPHRSWLSEEIISVTFNALVLVIVGNIIFQNQADFSSGLVANITAALCS